MTSDEIKQQNSMSEVIGRYGLKANGKGFACCPFHDEKTPSMKIRKDSYKCYGCGANGDIFTFVQGMDNLTFREAFISLGGAYEQTFSAKRKQEIAIRERLQRQAEQAKEKAKRDLNNLLITVYRDYIVKSQPFSDTWCYGQNQLQYQLHLHDYYAERM